MDMLQKTLQMVGTFLTLLIDLWLLYLDIIHSDIYNVEFLWTENRRCCIVTSTFFSDCDWTRWSSELCDWLSEPIWPTISNSSKFRFILIGCRDEPSFFLLDLGKRVRLKHVLLEHLIQTKTLALFFRPKLLVMSIKDS